MIRMLMHLLQLVLWAAILLGCADGSGYNWQYHDLYGTVPAISGLRGSTVELPCEVDGPVRAFIWYRHKSTGDPAATIVIQKFQNKVINNVGPRFIMTSTYSLVVRNLVVEDETTYSCHTALENGASPRLYINLTVIVLADPLHPTVDHCEPTSEGECTYTVVKLMEEFPIVCRVSMVRPPVSLSWTSMKGDTHSEEYARRVIYVEGGFWNVSLALKVSTHEIGRKFRCLAEGVGVKGSADMIALVKRYEPGTEQAGGTSMGWFIAVIVVLTITIVILIVRLGSVHRKSKARSRQPYYIISQPPSTELQVADKICCPIIVTCQNQDIEPYKSMFREFITDIIERFSLSPVFIVTRKNDDIGNPHDDKMIKLITELGGAPDRTFFVDNILEETNDEESKKTFLEILFKLLQVADDNIVRKANKIFQDGLTASST